MVNITLKDGKVLSFDKPLSCYEIAKSISEGLARNALAAMVNGERRDLTFVPENDSRVDILTWDDADGRWTFRHTASHILAQAVKRLYPQAKLAIGPAIDDGFYYDFDVEAPFTAEQLEKIEAEMKKIVKADYKLERFTLPRADAISLFKEKNEPLKVELIEDLPEGEEISLYKQDDFVDLCAGSHLFSTGGVKAFKLTSATGAYWRGDSSNKMLQRIYGTAFPKAALLEEHLALLEEAKKRDHRRLGKELGLFALLEQGPGFPFYLPNGMIVKNKLLEFWRDLHLKAGYKEISTPIILNRTLWEQSGHWDHYRDNMYTTVIDDVDFAVKPMSCPGGMLAYMNEMHSYRELPLRYAELGLVHRHELSGALHGLIRVRSFTQDDAHIFMTDDQIKDEIKRVVSLVDTIYSTFGFEYKIYISTMPEDHIGEAAEWDINIGKLKEALAELGMSYEINEGDGAFYGPKIDFHLKDSLNRTWQCGTIQLDSNLPERFDLEYTGADGEKHRPVMIHRAIFGSIERFIAILIEQFAGAFPLWLSPVQAVVLPISEKTLDGASKINDALLAAGIRAELDVRNEKIGYKIREAQLKKVPYMLVIGEKELENGSISVRHRSRGDIGSMSINQLIETILAEDKARSLD